MAQAFSQQLNQPSTHHLSFEERFGLIVDREVSSRDNRRLARLLKEARLRQDACIEDLDYSHQRGLDRSQIAQLVNCEWIRQHHNLHITGATGTGKSWIACAIGLQACRQGLAVRYHRLARLLDSFRIARGDGSFQRRLAQIAKIDLLILDDFALKPISPSDRHDLLEVVEDRHAKRSTLITSQLPISDWYHYLGDDPTVADALLDRLLSRAFRLELKGESMRKRQTP